MTTILPTRSVWVMALFSGLGKTVEGTDFREKPNFPLDEITLRCPLGIHVEIIPPTTNQRFQLY